MGRKRKTDDPIFKPMPPPNEDGTRGVSPLAGAAESLRKAIDNPPPSTKIHSPLSNYGADENPRQCVHCGGKNSRIHGARTTGRITTRYRNCLKCGKNFPTREIAP